MWFVCWLATRKYLCIQAERIQQTGRRKHQQWQYFYMHLRGDWPIVRRKKEPFSGMNMQFFLLSIVVCKDIRKKGVMECTRGGEGGRGHEGREGREVWRPVVVTLDVHSLKAKGILRTRASRGPTSEEAAAGERGFAGETKEGELKRKFPDSWYIMDSNTIQGQLTAFNGHL